MRSAGLWRALSGEDLADAGNRVLGEHRRRGARVLPHLLGRRRARDDARDARLREESTWVEHALGRIRALSPRATLLRGYAIVSTGDGEPVHSTTAVSPGDALVAMLADGTLRTEVVEVRTRKDGDA